MQNGGERPGLFCMMSASAKVDRRGEGQGHFMHAALERLEL